MTNVSSYLTHSLFQVCVEACPDYYYFAIPGGAQDLYNKLNLSVSEYKDFGPICDYSVDIDAVSITLVFYWFCGLEEVF